jgi:F-type H+-transporting ATPase subunit a
MNPVLHFASESGVPLAAETIFSIGNFDVTNSMLLGIIIAIGLSVVFVLAAKYTTARPQSKFAFFMESALEFVTSQLRTTLGSESKARAFLPLFAALFFFILLNNLIGLLPAMGGTVYVTTDEGLKAALLRPFTTDLNGTLALAIISIGTVQYFAIKERGGWGHLKHYYTVMTPWWNPMNFFIGTIEVLGELIRLLTLALRLFGVIYAGEVLLHVITGLSGNFAPIAVFPVVLMEIFFSVIQAYLFLMLSSTYLAIGTSHDAESSHPESHDTVTAHTAAGSKV